MKVKKIKDWLKTKPQFEVINREATTKGNNGILQVRRLSDGQIFSLKDTVIYNKSQLGEIHQFIGDNKTVFLATNIKRDKKNYEFTLRISDINNISPLVIKMDGEPKNFEGSL